VPIAFGASDIEILFNKEIKPIEWILHTVVSIIIAIAIPFALVHIAGYDTQILNGYVTEKKEFITQKRSRIAAIHILLQIVKAIVLHLMTLATERFLNGIMSLGLMLGL
jgi:hypothetical protein